MFVSVAVVLQGSMGSITCIAWKGDTLVLGDMDGNLNFWDLKGRVSRYEQRMKSLLKRKSNH
jgi:hypothetical protein